MPGVASLVFAWLLKTAIQEAFLGDRGTDQGPRVGKVGDGGWDHRA